MGCTSRHSSICGLIAWWLWLRFVRHVLESGKTDADVEVIKELPGIARAFKAREWSIDAPGLPKTRKPIAGQGKKKGRSKAGKGSQKR